MSETITIALAGNPNSGKTTIFNELTGLRQHVGNYAGVTVEKVTGRCRHGGADFEIVDLPGTYSLTAYSIEELVARRFLVAERPGVVVDIVDASNLERNLYLATQLMELGVPLVLALNMSDVARARGVEFDLPRLSALLGVPIVRTVGHRGKGLDEMMDAALAVARSDRPAAPRQVNYGSEIEEEIAKVAAVIGSDGPAPLGGLRPAGHTARWLAIKLLENDSEVRQLAGTPAAMRQVEESSHHLRTIFGDSPELVIAGRRYAFISGACQEAVRSTVEARHTLSDRIDTVLTHPIAGVPIFLGMMYLVFYLTFTLGDYPTAWLEGLFGWAGGAVSGLWPASSDSMLRSLLVDGIIGGVGGVVAFLPNIMLLFLGIAMLEDSGYMARAAFLMDRLMHRIGLHGKSFVPMLIGFGCSVPAILATRTLESRRDRLTTMLVVPLMSCGARLTIYALLIPAFFPPKWQAPVLWLIYLIGIGLAVGLAKLLRATVLRGEAPPFVIELPLYRLPTLRSLGIHMWDRSWMYLRKAGTVILGISILLWAMTSFPRKTVFDRDYAAETRLARAEMLAGLDAVGRTLGLHEGGDSLARALAPELVSAPPTEAAPGVRAASATASAPASPPAWTDAAQAARIRAFLRAAEGLDEIHRRWDAALAEAARRPGSAEHVAMEHAHRDAMDRLAGAGREAFDAARMYRDGVRPAYEGRLAEIRDARRAEQLAHTVAGRIGRAMAPALKPLGFDWRIGTALVGALAAKEVFVAQMGILLAVSDREEGKTLRARLRQAYTPLEAFCLMLFCLISAPCAATIATTWKESGSIKWAVLQLVGLTVLAYVVTMAVYQAGRLIG
jgi:ferrous iron transport protein B